MNVNIVPDIHTVEQANAALTDAMLGQYDAVNCARIAELFMVRARLWGELVKASPHIREEFLQAARLAKLADARKAAEWDRRAGDGRK